MNNLLKTLIVLPLIFAANLVAAINIEAAIFTSQTFKVPSVPIDKNTSSIIRVVCMNSEAYILLSNSEGSDFVSFEEDGSNCGSSSSEVTQPSKFISEVSFIGASSIAKNESGIFRTHCVNGYEFLSYSQKGKAPNIIQKKSGNTPKKCS